MGTQKTQTSLGTRHRKQKHNTFQWNACPW